MNLLATLAALIPAVAQAPEVKSAEYESYLAHVAAAEASLRLGDLSAFRMWLDRAPVAPRGFEWRWLDSLRDQSARAVALDSPGTALAVSPDGTRVAVGGLDGSVRFLELGSGKEVVKAAGHKGQVYRARFDAAGDRLVTASHDRTVKIWSVKTGELLVDFTQHKFPVGGAAFSPDGTRVASCSYERPPGAVVGTVHVWNAATGELVKTLEGGRKPLSEIEFSPDGKRLAAGSWDFCVFVWDVDAGGAPRKFAMPDEGKYNAVDAVAFSLDGTKVAAASKDDTARVWDVATGALALTLRGHTNHVSSVKFSHDGKTLATGSADETVRLWNALDGSPLEILRGHTAPVAAVAFAPGGKTILSVGEDKSFRAFDTATRAYEWTDVKTSDAAYACVFVNGGAGLASASFDGRVQLWDTGTWGELASWQAHPKDKSCHALAASPDGKVLYTGSYDKTVGLWDVDTRSELGRLEHDKGVYTLRLSKDGAVLAVALMDGSVAIWDVKSRTRRHLLSGHAGMVNDLAFAPDGALVASASSDKTVRLWEVKTGKESARVVLPTPAHSCLFTPSGGKLLTGEESGRVAAWDAPGWKPAGQVQCGNNGIVRLAIGDGGRRLAAVSRKVMLVDLDTLALTVTLAPHRESLFSCAWSPNGNYLVTAAMDGTLAVTDPRPLRERLPAEAESSSSR